MIELFASELNLDEQKKYSIFQIILSIVVSLMAGYFSWTCNSAVGISVLLKIVYALSAFLFGPLYFIYYILVQQNTCNLALNLRK
jgi:hypothetical protein